MSSSSNTQSSISWHGTTILAVRKGDKAVIAADGQVSFGNSVMKSNAKKLRTLSNGKICAGFAGSTADALTLFERLEAKLEKHGHHLTRACVELAKDWRTDKYLRRLEAMLIVVSGDVTLVITGNGDVLEPEHGAVAIGSGGNFALAAALALLEEPELDAMTIAQRAMRIAGDICVFTNHNIIYESIPNNVK